LIIVEESNVNTLSFAQRTASRNPTLPAVRRLPPDRREFAGFRAGIRSLQTGNFLGDRFGAFVSGRKIPFPEIGRHRYFHKLYALDITLDLRGATKSQIERAMQGHVLAKTELIGTYQKGDR
jgi:phosphatidylethanolamine-binding protein (PEBP) family uncharacterized protein